MKRNIDIQKEWDTIGAGFDSHIASPSFKIPDNYFDTLPDTMQAMVSATDHSSALPRTEQPFAIPDNYFHTLADQLMGTVRDFESVVQQTTIAGIPKTTPYSPPPAMYFEALADQVLAQVHQEVSPEAELSEAPLLSALKHSNPFSTPEIHIDHNLITGQVLPKETAQEETATAKSSPLMVVRKRLSWAQWSAAASVAIFFLMGAIWLQVDKMNTNDATIGLSAAPVTSNAQSQLAHIPEQDIAQYVEQHIDEFDEYTLAASLSSIPANIQTQNLESALGDIPDKDIEAYLNTY